MRVSVLQVGKLNRLLYVSAMLLGTLCLAQGAMAEEATATGGLFSGASSLLDDMREQLLSDDSSAQEAPTPEATPQATETGETSATPHPNLPKFPLPEEAPTTAAAPVAQPQAVVAPEAPQAATEAVTAPATATEEAASPTQGWWSRLKHTFDRTPAEATASETPATEPAPETKEAPTAPVAAAKAPVDAPAAAPSAEKEKKPAAAPLEKQATAPALKLPPATNANAALSSGQDGAFMRSLGGAEGLISLDVSNGVPADIIDPIQLDEAVGFALKNNFEAKASKSKLKSAYWEKIGAYSQYVPSLDFKYATGQENSAPASYNDRFGNRVLKDDHNRRDRTFAVRQPLIDLGVISDIVTSASKEDVAEQEDRDAREGVAYDTVNAYLKLVQARIAVQLADQYRGYLDNLSGRMQARVAGGGATAGDLERIKGRSAQAEAARIEAIGDYESNLAEFRRLTQVSPAQLRIPTVIAPEVPADVTTAVEHALADNPIYIASVLKAKVAKNSRDHSFAKTAPKLSLEYSDTYVYNAGGAARGNPVDGTYPTQQDKRLMLMAHWTLNGGIELTEGMAGVEKAREANYRSLDARARIEQGIRTSYNAINAANRRISVLQQGLAANTKVVAEFEDQYKNGSRSIFELLDAHEQLYSSRLNLMRLAIAKAQASYQVRRQMGDLLPTLVGQHQQTD